MININSFNAGEKILNNLGKVEKFINKDRTLIVTELDLTNHCNNKCPECIGMNGVKSELSWREITGIASDLNELGNQGVILSGGGEPLLHPYFLESVEVFKSYGIKIGVNSNGLMLDEKKAMAIASNCDYLRISLDAGDAALYKKTHGMDENNFLNVVENIKMMAEVKRGINSLLSFGTGFLTNKDTISQMEMFVLLSKKCGVDFAQFRPYKEDTTVIMKEYEMLKKYQSENFMITASIQKY